MESERSRAEIHHEKVDIALEEEVSDTGKCCRRRQTHLQDPEEKNFKKGNLIAPTAGITVYDKASLWLNNEEILCFST